MIKIKTNINVVNSSLIQKLQTLQNPRPLLRQVAINVLPLMMERIHEKGEDANGNSLGEYSVAYLKMRENNGRGNAVGKTESFTRQLQKSLGVEANEKGWYIGIIVNERQPLNSYLNKKNKLKGKAHTMVSKVSNSQIIKFQEQQLKRKIWMLNSEEKKYCISTLNKLVQQTLK